MRKLALFLALALGAIPATRLFAQCGTPGTGGVVPQIEISSQLWDSTTTFTVKDALPGAGWAWFMDFTPGPLPTPYGNFCIGPTFFTLFHFLPGQVPIGPNGRIDLTFPIPLNVGGAIGLPLYCQGVVVDPAGMNGLAITNGLPFKLTSPRVFVASDGGAIDLVDAYGASQGGPAPVQVPFDGSGHADFCLSKDMQRLYVRNNSSGTANGVKAFDITKSPAVFLGEAQVGANPLTGKPRNGVIVSNDDSLGYFVDDGFVHQFDADPASPTFMTLKASATSSVAGISLAISPDDKTVFVGDGTPGGVHFYDTASMVEVGSIQVTNAALWLGLALRYSIDVSPDGKWLATIQQGVYTGVPGLNGASILNVISIDPSHPGFMTEVAAVPLPNHGQHQFVFDPSDVSSATIHTVASDPGGNMELQTINWAVGQVTTTAMGVANGLGFEEGGIGMTPNGSFIFASARGNDTLHVFDANLSQVSVTPMNSSGRSWFIHVEQ